MSTLKRLSHVLFGQHSYEKSRLIYKLRSEDHPATDTIWVYTVNVRECSVCGLIFDDKGMERRERCSV